MATLTPSADDAAMRTKHSEIFVKDRAEDPRARTRTVPMQVLCLGLPRTGTVSMQHALQILGIPCHHSYQLFENIPDCWMWQDALNAKLYGKGPAFTRRDWDQLLGHVGAVTDGPAVVFGKELIDAYPDAKVVLVERDADAWCRSFLDGVMGATHNPQMERLRRTERTVIGPVGDTHVMYHHGWMDIHSREEAERKVKGFYEEYNARVKATTPPERLLVFRVTDGWKPLCEFLGKDVPDEPFPFLHQQELHQERQRLIAEMGQQKAQVPLPEGDPHKEPWMCAECGMKAFDGLL